MRTLRRMRWSWFGSRSGAGRIEREWYRLQILHEPSRQPPAFAIKAHRPRVNGDADTDVDHLCDRQRFERGMQASERVEVVGSCDLVSRSVRDAATA